ncbi:MAG: CBS domain-containing protein [Candidatus Aenigmarchaeota archaeon]|nr:CBS domain-containing protein [Candidatus Aenigmarchaeota archaeon]
MKVKEIMTKEVITFKPDDTLHRALMVFTKRGISGAPVVDGEKLLGLVTELDIIKVLDIYMPRIHFTSVPHFFLVLAGLKSKSKTTELKKKIIAASKLRVDSFMTKQPVIIDKNADIMEAARLIDTYKVNRIPVMEEGKLVGILTRNDIIKAVARLDLDLIKMKPKCK